jgi:CRISPR-associated protein Cas5h
MKILIFDIWGEYAHFKKIYATTSAITYLVPTKPTIYGYISSIIGLQKFDNDYLKHFADKTCLVGVSLQGSIALETRFSDTEQDGGSVLMRRMGINLRAQLGARKVGDSPKPTLIEFVYRPKYRLYVHHTNADLHNKLKMHLEAHTSVYTPTLGLASLLSNFQFVGEFDVSPKNDDAAVPINSIIPKKQFIAFDNQMFEDKEKEYSIVEQTMFAIEMDTERNVTERDDILLERTGKPILAKVTQFYQVNGNNIVLF